MVLVECDVVDCIFNKNSECENNSIEIVLNHDSDGIGRIECASYISDSSHQST